MRPYQETYVAQNKEIRSLLDAASMSPNPDTTTENTMTSGQFWSIRRRHRFRAQVLADANTELLRQNLMPVLDDIISAPEEEIRELDDFADHLLVGARQLDLVLNYMIRAALVTYARKWEKRDMLIRELYQMGMALFYMQSTITYSSQVLYSWKMSLVFGEAASYIRMYDAIEDIETRGYIHRAMGNLALAYSWNDEEGARRKIQAIRRSMQILSDPVYREKTPSLPWELYIEKSHRERITAMGYLRMMGNTEHVQDVVSEVLESTVYVREKELEKSRKRGKSLAIRWLAQYEIAQYHCGIFSLGHLLGELEKLYVKRNSKDITFDGIETNLFIPAIYSQYLRGDEALRHQKKQVVQYMYHGAARYVRSMSFDQLDAKISRNLTEISLVFIEYPDGLLLKDFLVELVASRHPELYVEFLMTGKLTHFLAERIIESHPEFLTSLPGCESAEQVRKQKEKILHFAYEAGLLAETGLLSVTHLVEIPVRSWFEEEKRIYETHVYAGRNILAECESTKRYAQTAFGYHRYYNERGGYPEAYSRRENEYQAITDIVSAASCLIRRMKRLGLSAKYRSSAETEQPVFAVDFVRVRELFSKALAEVCAQSGTRFSPDVAACLAENAEPLVPYLQTSLQEACCRAYEMIGKVLEE